MTYHRRDILRTGLLAGGGLLLGFTVPVFGGRLARAEQAPAAPKVPPTAFIQIGSDNSITLIMPDTECGQGIWTAAATLLAEELEVGLDQVKLMPAPPNLAYYTNADLGEQATGGSTSVVSDWKKLREAGARARIMLVQAAAQKWQVDPATCHAAAGVVHHDASGRSAPYGAVAEAANALPVPDKVALKEPADWTLIGKTQKRLDTPGKVNGTTVYGIDVQIPGMKIGTVAASPVIGGTLLRIDEAAARAVPGVRDVVKTRNAVAVIGDHFWAAKQGLAAGQSAMGRRPECRHQFARHLAATGRRHPEIRRGGAERKRCAGQDRRCQDAGEWRLSATLSLPRADGADQHHPAYPPRWRGSLGGHAGTGARPGGRRQGRRPQARTSDGA